MIQKPGANVRSSDAIEAFRSRLIIYVSKVRPLLDQAQDEVIRTREWIRTDRRQYWESELKKRKRHLEQTEQALFAAEFSNLRETTSAELLAVERAKRALADAEEKIRILKRWSLEFEHRVLPLLKHLERLQTTLSNDLPKGIEYLRHIIQAVDAYAETLSPRSSQPAGAEPEAIKEVP
jgi:hypothetical protein